MKPYSDILTHIIENGRRVSNRTGIDTLSVFGYQARYNLTAGFPLLTTKRLSFHNILHELLWFLRGDTNIKYLTDHKVNIWNEWADENGDLGPVYGKQWRRWDSFEEKNDDKDGFSVLFATIDQIADVVARIRTNPECRRLIVSAWNPADIPSMALPPCHVLFQFRVLGGYLHCHLYQRSADAFLGVPYNIASYALLTSIVAHLTGLEPGDLIHSFGDLHLYVNHLEQARQQLSREPRPLPTLRISPTLTSIDQIDSTNFILDGYFPHPPIKADVAV